MEKYFEMLEKSKQEACEIQKVKPNDIQSLYALAQYGDIDAVFNYAKGNINTWDKKFTDAELDKMYDKINRSLFKFQDVHKYKKGINFFSTKEKDVPAVMYVLGRFERRCEEAAKAISCMETAAEGGEPRAVYDLLKYYSTNEKITDSDNKYYNYNGSFDWDKFFKYAICGMGFTCSPYYREGYSKIFELSGGIKAKEFQKKAYRTFLKTLEYIADDELRESKEYKKKFGNFVPTEEQIMIARHWFFVEDERLAADTRVLESRKYMADRITAQVKGGEMPVRPEKKPAKKSDAASSEEIYAAIAAGSTASRSAETQPVAAKPTTAQPAATEPVAAKSTTAQPAETQPVSAKPTTAQPAATQPVSAKPTTAQPAETQPVSAKPTAAPSKTVNTTGISKHWAEDVMFSFRPGKTADE